MQEQLTVTMPIKEYDRLKDLEILINEYKKESCFIYEYESSQFACTPSNMPRFHVINPQKMDSLLGEKIVELEAEIGRQHIRIYHLDKEIEETKTPTLWQLLRKKLSL